MIFYYNKKILLIIILKLQICFIFVFIFTLVHSQQTVGRGKTCLVSRDKDRNILETRKCEKGLICAGFGPHEILNNGGGAHHTDFDIYRGICINQNDIETI